MPQSHTRDLVHYNGAATIALGIVKAGGSNPVQVIDRIRQKANKELLTLLPDNRSLTVVTDKGKPIASQISVLKSHLIEGTLLIAPVVCLFVQSARATTIIATAIPASLFGAIAGLYLFGYNFNSFTLLALLLLIGVVVKDAIVVLENIYKTKERDHELCALDAAEKGTSEVMFAVMAATLTLANVFGPVVFLPGVLGQYLESFAVTVVIGILVSWFVSVTLTPMLCARNLKVSASNGYIATRLQQGFRAAKTGYAKILSASLCHPKRILLIAVASLVPAAMLMGVVRTEFTPQLDDGRIAVQLAVASGLGKDTVQQIAALSEAQLAQPFEISGVLTTFEDGTQRGADILNLFLVLKDERRVPQKGLIEHLQKLYYSVPAWRANVLPAMAGSSNVNGAPLLFFLQGHDYATLR